MFDNPEIPLEALPAVEDLEWQGLHERYVRQLQLSRLGLVGALALALTIAGFVSAAGLLLLASLWLALFLFAILHLGWPAIAVPRRGYALRDKDIVYRSGVLWRTVTAVPFNRIQHVETSTSPLDRRFGTAVLVLFTAGGASADLRIAGLPADTAERLRAQVVQRIGAAVEED